MNFKGKKLLILGANPETVSLVKKCNELGIVSYVCDYNHNSMSKKYATFPCDIDASNISQLSDLIIKEKIDGILCGVAEALLPTYYELCSTFKMPCFGDKFLFNLFSSKEKFKKLCMDNDVPVVDEYLLDDLVSAKNSKKYYPVIVKPTDSCSSRGITICNDYQDLLHGVENSVKFSKTNSYLIEKYMNGLEAVVYYGFQNGNVSLLAMCDRYTNKEQKNVAQLPTAYIFPSRFLKKYLNNNNEKTKLMLKKANIKNGFMFIQSFVDDGIIKFYESGYRLNGAQEHYIVSKATGIDAKECLINYALSGKEANYKISEKANPFINGKYGCKLSPLVKTGKIAKIL